MDVPFYCTVPAYVLRDVDTPANGKLLYAVISHMTHAKGREAVCTASNEELAEVFGWSERTVTRLLQSLEKAGFLAIRSAQSGRELVLIVSAPDRQSLDHWVDKTVYPGRQNCLPPGQNCLPSLDGTSNVDSTGNNIYNNINNNINNNTSTEKERKESKKEKKENSTLSDDDLYTYVTNWIQSIGPDWWVEDKKALRDAILAFYTPREQKDKTPARSKIGVTRMLNKLARECNGEPLSMINAVDDATAHGWTGIYPRENGRAVSTARPDEGGGNGKWL